MFLSLAQTKSTSNLIGCNQVYWWSPTRHQWHRRRRWQQQRQQQRRRRQWWWRLWQRQQWRQRRIFKKYLKSNNNVSPMLEAKLPPPGFFLQKTFLVLTLMSALQTWLMKNGRIIRARISWRVALTVLHCCISWRQVVLNNINVAVLCDGLSRWWGRITCYSEPVFESVSLVIKHMKWRSFYLWGATFAHGSVAKWGALSHPGRFLGST